MINRTMRHYASPVGKSTTLLTMGIMLGMYRLELMSGWALAAFDPNAIEIGRIDASYCLDAPEDMPGGSCYAELIDLDQDQEILVFQTEVYRSGQPDVPNSI